MGGLSVEAYEATPALTVDYDLEFARIEAEVQEAKAK